MAEEVVNEPVVAEPTPTASTAEETKPEVVESEQEIADKAVTESLSKDTEDKPEEEAKAEPEAKVEETPETQPQGKAEERKQQLNTEIRDLVSQRNALKAQVEEANAKVYQPATDTELLGQINPETGDYYNSLEAKVAAMQQAQEMERYNNQVAEVQLTLSSEASAALKDFPMFDETDKEKYNPELAKIVDPILAANLVFDPNTGQVIGAHVSPYTLYKTIADAANMGVINGQIKGQKATEKMQSRVDSTSNAAPKKSEDDPFLKGLQGNK
jgi:hypothetical protein